MKERGSDASSVGSDGEPKYTGYSTDSGSGT